MNGNCGTWDAWGRWMGTIGVSVVMIKQCTYFSYIWLHCVQVYKIHISSWKVINLQMNLQIHVYSTDTDLSWLIKVIVYEQSGGRPGSVCTP